MKRLMVAAWLAVAGFACMSRGPGLAGLGGRVVDEPFEKPAAVLTDTDGIGFDIRQQTDGLLTVMVMGYTRCPDVCPATLASIAAGLADLDPLQRERIMVVFVSADRRDSPAEIRAFLDHFDPGFVGLSGDSAQVAGLARSLAMADPWLEPAAEGPGYVVAHSGFVPVFTPDNRAHLIYPAGTSKATWRSDLPRLLGAGVP